MTGGELRLVDLTKRYGAETAVDDLSLHVPAGSLTALLGPSGCGKSTTLAMVGGLVTPDGGNVILDGHSLTGVPPERRPVATVFQKPLLFPHLDVAANIGFGLRMRRVPKDVVRGRVHEMLERVQLSGLGSRRVGELSGGQEQRVALARALVLQPRVLLLDEPFSQLDAGLRVVMRRLVLELHRVSGLTTVFVTHDQAEAVDIADRVALLLSGRLEGHATSETFYRRPPSLAAARFFGATNEVAGTVTAGWFEGDGMRVRVRRVDGPAVLVLRPESLRMTETAGPGAFAATVTAAAFAGTHVRVTVATSTGAAIAIDAPSDTRVVLGERLHVALPDDPPTFSALEDVGQTAGQTVGEVPRGQVNDRRSAST